MAFFAIGINALSAQSGTIIGHVSNAGTGAYLEGAVVTLQPSGASTLTSRDGRFSFSQVPAGQHELTIAYTGLDSQTISVSVTPGTVVDQDVRLTSQIYQLEKFVVPGEREGNALAVTMQRIAPNIKNVLSADAFGNIADQNLGNFLLRLPGISTEKSEGEIYRVQVRGVNADLNAVTIDGTRAASGSTRGLSRGFEIDKVPADFIESIEVTKAPTPDMDADSIGGAVNLKTKSALDRRERTITYTAGTSFNPDRETFRPAGNLMYSNLIGDRIGLLLTGSYSESHKPRDSSNIAWERTTDTSRPVWFHQTDIGEDELEHTRAGLGVRVDYKLAENSTVYFNAMYSFYDDRLERRRGGHTNISTASPSPNIVPGWTDTVTETVGGRFRLTQLIRDRDITTYNYQIGGDHRWSTAELDWTANYSPSEGTEHRDIFSSEVRNVGFRHERDRGGKNVRWTQTSGPDVYNIANFTFLPLEMRDFVNNDEILGAQLNLRKKFETTRPSYIKTGFRVRSQERKQDEDRDVYDFVGTSASKLSYYDPSYNYSSYDGYYRALQFNNVPMIASAIRSGSSDFRQNLATSLQNSIINDGVANEDVYAGYIMGGVALGKLNILAGVRMEATRIEATGNIEELTPEEVARRAAWTGALTNEEIRRRTLAQYGNLRTAKGSYNDYFPGVHFRYELRPGLVARTSWSTGIGRPNFDSLLPDASINHDNQSIRANNTELRPQYSDNFDVALEYYFEPSGLVSFGAFYKEITDFVYEDDAGVVAPGNPFGEQYVGYSLRTDFNGGTAKIKGLEFAYQQQFSFLPGFWKGFGAFANYTYLESEGNYGGPGSVVTDAELENFTPRTANVGISYIGHNWTVRAQMNYTGVHLDSYDSDPSRRQYIFANNPIDLNIRYDFSPRFGIYLDVINVFNEPTNHEYTFTEYRRNRNDLYTTMWKMGISGRF